MSWLAGRRLLAGGDDLNDMAVTIEAEDAFDLAWPRRDEVNTSWVGERAREAAWYRVHPP